MKKEIIILVLISQSNASCVQLNFEHSEYAWINPKEFFSYKLGRVLTAIKSFL